MHAHHNDDGTRKTEVTSALMCAWSKKCVQQVRERRYMRSRQYWRPSLCFRMWYGPCGRKIEAPRHMLSMVLLIIDVAGWLARFSKFSDCTEIHTCLESSMVQRKRLECEGKEETKFNSCDRSISVSRSHDTWGGEAEEAQEALCQTSDSFRSAICSRAMLEPIGFRIISCWIPEARLICFSGFTSHITHCDRRTKVWVLSGIFLNYYIIIARRTTKLIVHILLTCWPHCNQTTIYSSSRSETIRLPINFNFYRRLIIHTYCYTCFHR